MEVSTHLFPGRFLSPTDMSYQSHVSEFRGFMVGQLTGQNKWKQADWRAPPPVVRPLHLKGPDGSALAEKRATARPKPIWVS